MPLPNFYHVLGVPQYATVNEIKTAYRELARKYHPDGKGNEASNEVMKTINTAYATLSDPFKRRNYDRARGKELSPKLIYQISVVPLNVVADQYFNTDFGIYVRTNDPEILFFARRWEIVGGTIDTNDGVILVTRRSEITSNTMQQQAAEADEYLRGILKRRNQERITARKSIHLALANVDKSRDKEFTNELQKFVLQLKFVALGQEYIHIQDLIDLVGLYLNQEYDEAKWLYGSDSMSDWLDKIMNPE